MSAVKQGNVHLSTGIVLKNVLYVPNMKCSLIYIRQSIQDSCCTVTFNDKFFLIKDRNTRTSIGQGELRNGVYYFKTEMPQLHAHATTTDTTMMLH